MPPIPVVWEMRSLESVGFGFIFLRKSTGNISYLDVISSCAFLLMRSSIGGKGHGLSCGAWFALLLEQLRCWAWLELIRNQLLVSQTVQMRIIPGFTWWGLRQQIGTRNCVSVLCCLLPWHHTRFCEREGKHGEWRQAIELMGDNYKPHFPVICIISLILQALLAWLFLLAPDTSFTSLKTHWEDECFSLLTFLKL